MTVVYILVDTFPAGKLILLMLWCFHLTADLATQALPFPYQTAAAAAASLTSTQFPFVFNSALLPLPSGLSLGEPLPIKTEAPTTQSRGTSPIIFSALPSSDVTQYGGVKEAAVAADIKKEVRGTVWEI